MAGGSIVRWVLGKAFRLPPRRTSRVLLETGLKTPMRDGVELIADRYHSPDFPKRRWY